MVEGPYGELTGETCTGGPVVRLARGIGVTPLLSLLGELPYRPGEATLIYRAQRGRAGRPRRAGVVRPAPRGAGGHPARTAPTGRRG
ncbi:hypothetical protein [Actinoplanes teichomyceticus]|uniref:hypothetical protein n=1 Tax=Actinoplanes teichomyceticus TaxID=1867 RepID=UPI0016568C88|nr:hypothetical protein [Actinoplanes teichomyceticus]GIF14020.1 hypothetical protein Ate01nite_40520 [Actinoplanes teichomyceticus]